MEPWQSWAAVLILGALAYYYYSTQTDSRSRAQRTSGRRAARPEVKSKRKGEGDTGDNLAIPDIISSDGGSGDAVKRKKPAKKTASQSKPLLTPTAPQVKAVSGTEPEEPEDREWAAQLASLKKGSSLTAPPSSEKRLKTVRQSGAEFSSTSSTAGADADDDLSPAVSPSLGAKSAVTSSRKDVSDMLEPAAQGPSVLRLTEPTDVKPSKPSKQQSSNTQQIETKKQRQNRKKVEEQKAVREEQERERRSLMEKQRRTAREARGEPAKDGTASAKALASNAWVSKAVTSAPVAATVGPTDGLLDTFDPNQDSQTKPAPNPLNNNGENWGKIPSEEEQMRLAIEDSGWNTVPKGRKGKKKPGTIPDDTTGNESSDTGIPAQKAVPKGNIKKVESQLVNEPPKVNGGSIYEYIAHPQDSDWAVV